MLIVCTFTSLRVKYPSCYPTRACTDRGNANDFVQSVVTALLRKLWPQYLLVDFNLTSCKSSRTYHRDQSCRVSILPSLKWNMRPVPIRRVHRWVSIAEIGPIMCTNYMNVICSWRRIVVIGKNHLLAFQQPQALIMSSANCAVSPIDETSDFTLGTLSPCRTCFTSNLHVHYIQCVNSQVKGTYIVLQYSQTTSTN